jgi:thioredoxin reductase (NADPH)
MANRPVILSVDDDPEVLRAVARDLRKQYNREYRVMSVDSGELALETLRELQVREEPVALIVSDHRMPGMDGVRFLEQASALAPGSKRVLLTAYAETDAAIRAINTARIDYYLLKPWDPPETNLYPVLTDLLEDWRENYRPPFEGLRLIGSRWDPASFEMREFLARNRVPYKWLEVEGADAQALLAGTTPKLPFVILEDGERLEAPSTSEIAARVGLQTQANEVFYDLVIVGGGPSGLAAAVYGASEGLKTLLLERDAPGGQAGLSSRIENYLGFPSGLSGSDLARRAVTQAQRFGVEILSQEVTKLRADGQYRTLTLGNGSEISSHAVLISTGVQWRKLEQPGFERLTGAGVYYGAGSTEALACRNEDVFIIGGANSAGQAAMNFSKFARKVVMLVRGASLAASMSQYLIDQIRATPNIEVRLNTSVTAVHGTDRLERITLHCSLSDETSVVEASSLFIFVGAAPRTDWLDGQVARDKFGFVLTGPNLPRENGRVSGWSLPREPFLLETNLPGVFATGDVRSGSVKRVASGVGEGSISVAFVHQYLAEVGGAA